MIIETNMFTGNTEQKKIHAKYVRKCIIHKLHALNDINYSNIFKQIFFGTIKKDGVFELEKPNDF